MRRQILISVLLLVTVIGAALAQQAGSIGGLRGRTDSTGALVVADTGGGGGGGTATIEEQEIQTGHLEDIKAAAEAANTADTLVRKVSGADGDVADDEFAICTVACTITAIDCINTSITQDAYFKMTNATAANTTPGSTAVAITPFLIPFNENGPSTHRKLMFVSMGTAATGYFSTGAGDTDATDVPNGEVTCTVEKR